MEPARRAATHVDAGSFDDTALARVPPFDAVELPVGRLFLPKKSEEPTT